VFAFADDDDVDAVEFEYLFGECGWVEASHDNEFTGFFGYSGELFGLVEGAGHGGDGDEVYGTFFEECAKAVEDAVVVVVVGHDEAFDVVLDGGGEVTDADAVGYKSGKGYDDGLGGLDKAEIFKVCHRIQSLSYLFLE